MSDLKLAPVPMARTEDILVESLEGEVLIYDLRTHEATCLNASAALIWELCDSQRTIGDIVDEVDNAEVTERHVTDTLDQLREKNLLEAEGTQTAPKAGAPASRRSFLGHAAAVSLVLPAVMSTTIPAAAQQTPIGFPCQNPADCNGSPGVGDLCCCGEPGGPIKCCQDFANVGPGCPCEVPCIDSPPV